MIPIEAHSITVPLHISCLLLFQSLISIVVVIILGRLAIVVLVHASLILLIIIFIIVLVVVCVISIVWRVIIIHRSVIFESITIAHTSSMTMIRVMTSCVYVISWLIHPVPLRVRVVRSNARWPYTCCHLIYILDMITPWLLLRCRHWVLVRTTRWLYRTASLILMEWVWCVYELSLHPQAWGNVRRSTSACCVNISWQKIIGVLILDVPTYTSWVLINIPTIISRLLHKLSILRRHAHLFLVDKFCVLSEDRWLVSRIVRVHSTHLLSAITIERVHIWWTKTMTLLLVISHVHSSSIVLLANELRCAWLSILNLTILCCLCLVRPWFEVLLGNLLLLVIGVC